MGRLKILALAAVPLFLVGLVVWDVVSKKIAYDSTPARELTWDATCDPSYDGKKVAISGHVSLYPKSWGSMLCSKTDCDLALLAAPRADRGLRVKIPTGNGKNHMIRLTNETTPATLELKDAKGARAGSQDRVRLVGTMLHVQSSPSFCVLSNVTSIEKL